MGSEKGKSVCKECHMTFLNEERMKKHYIKAHPKKQKFVHPSEYWHDPGGGV